MRGRSIVLLSEDEQLILMAAAAHDLGPGTHLGYANARRVVRQVLRWKGLEGAALEAAWNPYDGSPDLDAVYEALVGMMRSGVLMEGYGNFKDDPPAFPDFVSCRLTERGLELAEQLLSERPHLRASVIEYRAPRRMGVDPDPSLLWMKHCSELDERPDDPASPESR